MRKLNNILQLGIKELRSLYRDPALLLLILYAFTLSIYSQANSVPESPHRASIGVLDEDRSQLSTRIVGGFQLPYFIKPAAIDLETMDSGMDAGRYTFTLNIPPQFQQDLLAGRQPTIQLNVDAQQVRGNFRTLAENHCALDGVFQFTHVTRPAVIQQMTTRSGA